MSGLELGQLRYFVTVARELHFSRAAERMGIDQAALSRQIQALERIIGVRLLWRTSRCTRLTGAGQVFLLEAERILSVVDSLRKAAREASHQREAS
jgi:DNA-binding transcriptional LysR family regulator